MRCRRSDAVAVLVPLWLLAVPVSAEPPPPDGSFARYEGVFQLPTGRAIVLTTTGVIADLAKPVFIDWDAYRAGQLVVAAEDSLVSPAVGDPQAATLRLPAAAGSFPAVVLVHGSGPGERSYFAVMSSYFASLGMAVLTYDKRGCGGSSGDWREVDLDVLAQDALAPYRRLRCPTLVKYGRLDYSVPVAESVDLLAAVADSTAAGLLTVRVIADTGHGYVRMQEDNPLAPVAPQTLSPEFFQTIADWLRTLGVI